MLDFSNNERNFWLVFASEDDRYYTDSLMELTLEQYLWLSLRKSYQKVWYVSLPDPKNLIIRSFDDDTDASVSLVSRKNAFLSKKFFSHKTSFEWFREQAGQNGRQAFVMDKTSFRNLFVSGCPVSDYMNIAVVLLLRPTINDLKEVMAEDYPLPKSYADYIRQEKTGDIMSRLDCIFLPSFTEETIRNMLTLMLFSDTQKANAAELIAYMTAYLCYYMNHKGAQWEDHLQLLRYNDPLKYPLCPLHKDIRDRVNWQKLTETAEYLKSLNSQPDKAVKMYAQKKNLAQKKDALRFMLPVQYSIQEKCIRSTPMPYGITVEEIPESIRKWVMASYEKINRLSMTIGSGEENQVIKEQLDNLLGQLDKISHEDDSRLQYERYFRYFMSAGQCMEHLYEPDDAKAKLLSERIDRYLEMVEKLFDHINDWDEDKTQQAEEVLKRMDEYFYTGRKQEELDDVMCECDRLIQSNQRPRWVKNGSMERMQQWKNMEHLPDTSGDSVHKKWITP